MSGTIALAWPGGYHGLFAPASQPGGGIVGAALIVESSDPSAVPL